MNEHVIITAKVTHEQAEQIRLIRADTDPDPDAGILLTDGIYYNSMIDVTSVRWPDAGTEPTCLAADIIICLDGHFFSVELNGGAYRFTEPPVQPLLITYLGNGELIESQAAVSDSGQVNLHSCGFPADLYELLFRATRHDAADESFTFVRGAELCHE